MKLGFLSKNKHKCDECNEKFKSYDELIYHARHTHHHTIVSCTGCGKEFIHEKDRLHHMRQEHEEKMKDREHHSSGTGEFKKPKDSIEQTSHKFSDEL